MRYLIGKTPQDLIKKALCELHDHNSRWPAEHGFFIVPETLKADTERRYLETWPEDGLLLAEVLSFQRLASRLLDLCKAEGRRALSAAGQALLLMRLLEDEERYPTLHNYRGRPAYALELGKVFGDFVRYDLPTDLLLKELDGTDQASRRWRDMAAVFSEYEARRDAMGMLDQDRRLSRLASLLDDGLPPRLSLLKDTHIWVVGFGFLRDFTEQEYRLMAALSRHVAGMTIALLEAGATDRERNDMIDRRLGFHLGGESWAGGWSGGPSRSSSQSGAGALVLAREMTGPAMGGVSIPLQKGLSDLTADLTADPIAVPETAASLQASRPVLSTPGTAPAAPGSAPAVPGSGLPAPGSAPAAPQVPDSGLPAPTNKLYCAAFKSDEEVRRFAAGEMKRLLREEGYHRRDIAVVYLGEGDLLQTFKRFSLDVYRTESRPLGESSFMRYICALFSVMDGYDTLAALRQMALTGLWVDSLDDFDDFAAFCEEFGLSRPDQLRRDRFYEEHDRRMQELAGQRGRADQREQAETDVAEAGIETGDHRGQRALLYRRTHVDPVLDAARAIDQEKTALGKGQALLWALASLGVRTRLEERSKKTMEDPEGGAGAEEDQLSARAWQTLISLIGESGSIWNEDEGGVPIETRAWTNMLLRVLLPLSPGRIPMGVDRIRILSAEEALFYPCKALFILGLTEGSLPRIRADEGILPNVERDQLNELFGLRLPKRKEDQIRQASLLEAQLPHVPTERFYVLQEGLDDEDRSDLLRSWLRLYHQDTVPQPRDDLPDQRHLNVDNWREGRSAFRAVPEFCAQLEAEARRRGLSIDSRPDHSIEERFHRISGLKLDRQDDIIKGLSSKMSISQIQRYNECPYAHFWTFLVGLKETPEAIPDPRLRGSILHRLFEVAMQELQAEIEDLAPEETIDLLQKKLAMDDSGWRDWASHLMRTVLAEPLYLRYLEPEQHANLAHRIELALKLQLHLMIADFRESLAVPYALEWNITGHGDDLVVDIMGNRFTFKGVIDRVDRRLATGSALQEDGDRYRILDYKTGKKDWKVEHLLMGTDIQLPFYAYAWQHHDPKAEVDLGFIKVTAQKRAKRELDKTMFIGSEKEDVKEELDLSMITDSSLPLEATLYGEFARFVLKSSIEELLRGHAEASPLYLDELSKPCKYCKMKYICLNRRDVGKERDERVTPLKESALVEALKKEKELSAPDSARSDQAVAQKRGEGRVRFSELSRPMGSGRAAAKDDQRGGVMDQMRELMEARGEDLLMLQSKEKEYLGTQSRGPAVGVEGPAAETALQISQGQVAGDEGVATSSAQGAEIAGLWQEDGFRRVIRSFGLLTGKGENDEQETD